MEKYESCETVENFELSESPAGRLASFQGSDALAAVLLLATGSRAFATVKNGSLVARLAATRVELPGAGASAEQWRRQSSPCFICVFHPSLPQGARAFELRWA